MLHSRYVVRALRGEVLGIFSAPLADHAAPIRALVAAHPGAKVESIVTTDSPCPDHPAFEVHNCPSCSPT